MARNITSANADLQLAVTDFYPIPQQIQGFSADDIFDSDAVTPNEVSMGLDGKLSAGRTRVATPMNITLQSDSLSNDFFENWDQAEKASGQTFYAQGQVTLPGTGRKYTLTNGVLTSLPRTPSAKRTLQPRRYTITWEDVSPANF